MHTQARRDFVYWFVVVSAVVFSVALAALVAGEVYVRWAVNQNFSFLGGSGFLGLCVLVLGLTLGLVYSQRQ